MAINLVAHNCKIYCICSWKTSLELVVTSLDQDWTKTGPRLKKTAVLVFSSPGLVFWGFRKCVDWSWSWSFHFGPKDQTGLDFQALFFMFLVLSLITLNLLPWLSASLGLLVFNFLHLFILVLVIVVLISVFLRSPWVVVLYWV